MNIRRVTKKDREAFNEAAIHPLQSWEWGEFRKKTGNQIVRLAVYKNNKLIDTIQVTLHNLPGVKYKIGTVIKGPSPTKELIKELRKLGKEERTIFIKLEPNIVISDNLQATRSRLIKLLHDGGCVPGKTLFTPTSFWIDLTPTEEELMKSFHPKTRYNIRLAKRRGVRVVEDNSKKAFEKYIELTRETVKRQGFYAHSEKYHRLMWKYLHQLLITNHQQPIARLLTARYKNEIITAWVVFVWHDFLYYPYGASSDKYKNVMASNLVMWEAIRYGKALGLKTFDLWGREPGKGFTRFKEGYNPKVVKFLGSWDLITSPLYYPYRLIESVRWSFLRFRTKFALARPSF